MNEPRDVFIPAPNLHHHRKNAKRGNETRCRRPLQECSQPKATAHPAAGRSFHGTYRIASSSQPHVKYLGSTLHYYSVSSSTHA